MRSSCPRTWTGVESEELELIQRPISQDMVKAIFVGPSPICIIIIIFFLTTRPDSLTQLRQYTVMKLASFFF